MVFGTRMMMTIKQFEKHTGWDETKIRNFIRENVFPTHKEKENIYILEHKIPTEIKDCYGALTIMGYSKKIPNISQFIKAYGIKHIGEIRKQKYYRKQDFVDAILAHANIASIPKHTNTHCVWVHCTDAPYPYKQD